MYSPELIEDLRNMDIRVSFVPQGLFLHAQPSDDLPTFSPDFDRYLVGSKVRSISDVYTKSAFLTALESLPTSTVNSEYIDGELVRRRLTGKNSALTISDGHYTYRIVSSTEGHCFLYALLNLLPEPTL